MSFTIGLQATYLYPHAVQARCIHKQKIPMIRSTIDSFRAHKDVSTSIIFGAPGSKHVFERFDNWMNKYESFSFLIDVSFWIASKHSV